MAYLSPATLRYFHRVRRYILSDGERFATVVDEAGAPAYYPTALALSRRSHGHSSETMGAEANDLVHLGLWALRERININARLEAGAYFDLVEIETLAEACGLKTAALRRIALPAVKEMRRGVAMSKADIVSDACPRPIFESVRWNSPRGSARARIWPLA